MRINFQEIFDGYSKSTQRAWEHDRTKTVGASEIGQCLRRTFFTKKKYKHDPEFVESYGATTRGSAIEAGYVVPALTFGTPEDAELLWAGDDQVTLIDDLLSATPDGLLKGLDSDALIDYGIPDIESDCILIEIKSFDSRINLNEPKPVHAWQVQQQFGLVHAKTNHRPEYAVILYINAAWYDDVRPFVIKRESEMYGVCKTRAQMVYDAEEPSEIAPEGKISGGKECGYCPFVRQCSAASASSVPINNDPSELSPKDERDLLKLITIERGLKTQIKELTLQQKEQAEAIKQWLRDQGKGFAKVGDYIVTYKKIPGRKTVDYKSMAADNSIDITQYTREGEATERLTIKAPGDDDED